MKRIILTVCALAALTASPALASLATLSGTVTSSADGAPLENICVWAQSDPYAPGPLFGYDTTDALGRYSIRLNPGRYIVRFDDCIGSAGRPNYLSEYYDNATEEEDATAVLVSPLGLENIDAVLDPEARIEGRVTDAVGEPLENVCVSAEGPESTLTGAGTASDGTYVLEGLRPGAHRVLFEGQCTGRHLNEYYDDAEFPADATLVPVAPGERRVGIDASLARAPGFGNGREGIRGRVTLPDGTPLVGACVDASLVENGYVTYPFAHRARTDETGRYFADTSPGTYRIAFVDCNGSGFDTEWFDDAADQYLATSIEVSPNEVEVADAVIDLWPEGDAGVEISVENVPLRTDAGALPVQPGTQRAIHVDLTNDSPVRVWLGGWIDICPRTEGQCEYTNYYGASVGPRATIRRTVEWDATGFVGDVRVTASLGSVAGIRDSNYENDRAWVNHYAVIGGTGRGVGLPIP